MYIIIIIIIFQINLHNTIIYLGYSIIYLQFNIFTVLLDKFI
jgi:hypothetical protein